MKVLSYMVEAHIFREVDNKLEFLMLKRSEMEIFPGLWQMVTGSIDQGEKAFETAFREIKEETGIVPEKLWLVPYINSFYSWRRNHICMVPVFAAMAKEGTQVKISHEHSEYQWVSKEKALELLAWPGQKASVEIICEYFTKEHSFLYFEEISIKKYRDRNFQPAGKTPQTGLK
ncbi:MAG: NUDIX hydrolase [Bacteroidota bacterium]|nr:NUDIX pyrophosphatase [Ignavibacteria bacterium]MCU7500910.1 NUDIX pyrophosphatase [Ignavibacteria bacterium]MCU7511903.1 NUDIX pyrophosphatase [Ignavibacteria bacterium]MCU7522478.1 NUDIX pyrophosphatase [Ignavibacteria bacterium]MCU7525403.1 NUDIX pyrophosphatase [Ignavibacteria bacterium]